MKKLTNFKHLEYYDLGCYGFQYMTNGAFVHFVKNIILSEKIPLRLAHINIELL